VNAGGSLWFAPDDALLAVSTRDHIDILDLNTVSTNPVVTYPAIATDDYPQVLWSADGLGFKTVVPAPGTNGEATFLFVFTSGTVANLAKIKMVSRSESLPFISPDGGYVIYVAKLGDNKESLYLMDSSGATKPYGEAGSHVRALGWLPDSRHFLYSQGEPVRFMLGEVGGSPVGAGLKNYQTLRWTDMEHFLALQDGKLYLVDLSGREVQIDVSVSDFDFALTSSNSP